MSDGSELQPPAPPTASDKAPPHPDSIPFYYTLLAQQETTRMLPPFQLAERHIAAQSESLLRPMPFGLLNLSANPLFFGTVMAAMPSPAVSALGLPYYYSVQGFPAGGLSYGSLVPDVLRVDRARFNVRDADTDNDEKSEKNCRPAESDCPGEARPCLEEQYPTQNVPATCIAPLPFENRPLHVIMSPPVSMQGASNATSDKTSGDEEAERVVASKDMYNVLAQKPCATDSHGPNSGISLEELLKHEVKKPSVAVEEGDSIAAGMYECVTPAALPGRPLHGHFQLFYRLFLSSGMSDTLRIRSLATDESGMVAWIEITRKASHIDPTYGPVDAVRILVSSNGLCKMQLTHPFMRTVKTRLMPNSQEDVDSLLAELGPQSVLCPGIQDYEYRFPSFGQGLPLHVRVTDTLNGTKRYDHERCPLWHVPGVTAPGQWGLHNVCRCCRQIDGMLAKLSAQPRAHTTGICFKRASRRMYALSDDLEDNGSAQLLVAPRMESEKFFDGEEKTESPTSSGTCSHETVDEEGRELLNPVAEDLCSPGAPRKLKAS